MKTYEYFINLDERGSFLADVRDPKGKTVFIIKAGNELSEDETSIFDDGYMDHPEDLVNLADYLRDLKIMSENDDLAFG